VRACASVMASARWTAARGIAAPCALQQGQVVEAGADALISELIAVVALASLFYASATATLGSNSRRIPLAIAS
jgi:hypothetical protein